MKLILFADADSSRETLQKLFKKIRHSLECRELDEVASSDLEACDVVLLDGSARGCAAQTRLLKVAHELRCRAPRMPILILSSFDAGASEPASHRGCGVTISSDVMWQVHCRLKELAWGETGALLREALTRDAPEPVVFEYRG